MAVAGAFVVPHPPIIFPEIGHGEQFRISKTIEAYKEAAERIALMQPETIVILSPHSTMYKDYFHISPGFSASGNFERFGAEKLEFHADYDAYFAYEIERLAKAEGFPAGMEGEREQALDHGTMIPLRFIQEVFHKPFKIVRIGLSGLSLREHFRLGTYIKEAAEKLERRIVVVASGDLSHRLLDSGPYEFAKEGPKYDKQITELLAKGNLEEAIAFSEEFCEKAGECGHRSICIMAGCMKGITLNAELLSYEGPFGVGYCVAAFQDVYVVLARKSLEYYIKNGRQLSLENLPKLPSEMLAGKTGVFVSLKKDGNLRGCIGTIQGVQGCIAEEIIENAISAGIWDPRFPQVKEEEIPDILCTVDVLSQPEPVKSKMELDVKKYGVIVSSEGKRGLLLPNLDGVDTVEKQITIALQKAGIEEEDYLLEKFEVMRHY